MTQADVSGFCKEGFEPVREVFAKNLDAVDVGASVAVTVDGEFVVDLWGGYADAEKTRPWQEDTIVNVYSSTKTMAALCALMLADRGELDTDAPVKQYWPEFAAGGKDGVLVRHLLGHTAGLSGFEGGVSAEQLYDWDGICSLLASQEPWWEPGSASGYHALTQGYLVGEVVRRITGKSLGTFFREEVAEPLNADFHIGLDPKHFDRVADLIPPEATIDMMVGDDPNSIAARTFGSAPVDVEATRTTPWRSAEIPAANGHGNARSMARAQTPLACGGSAFGVTLLSPKTCDRVFEKQAEGMDLVLNLPFRLGLGYGLVNEAFPFSPNPRTCFWGGYGGSLVVVDHEARACITYAMNKMLVENIVGDHRGAGLLAATYESLGQSK